jgi:hypothetical protein
VPDDVASGWVFWRAACLGGLEDARHGRHKANFVRGFNDKLGALSFCEEPLRALFRKTLIHRAPSRLGNALSRRHEVGQQAMDAVQVASQDMDAQGEIIVVRARCGWR